jgi:predicted  nucleic acid-binding Zn-ribbon protein
MKIKKFNENVNRDAMYAIADSFNKVKEELNLLNKRLGLSVGKSEELDEFDSEVSQMKINFDELLSKFNDFDNKFSGR